MTRSRTSALVSILALVASFLVAAPAFPQARDVTGLERFVLDNGMEVFALENHVVPLTRIQITFRCGAIAQTPETVGLFHLYEHMLFKGNRAYPDQAAFQAAMKELGVADWNGGTSNESVSYYFTVPSDRVEKGIEFWANAVRFPLFDPGELATEKNVVVNEILGYLSDPGNIYGAGVDKAMYWKYPWRRDVGGYEKSVRSATVQMLRDIQDAWYVPNNAAIFVGGDIDPEAVRAAVQRYFGDWRKKGNPWASLPPSHPAPPQDAFLVYPDEQMYAGIAYVSLLFRGPDVTVTPDATYAADVWLKLLDDPNGKFKADIFAKVPDLYKKEYIWAEYPTQRDGGAVGFSTYMLLSQKKGTFARAADVKNAVTEEMGVIARDPAYFTTKDYEVLKRQLADQRILERETIDGFIGDLSFWWATAGTDYYNGYLDHLARVGRPDIVKFLSDFVLSRTSILSVRMNPQDFAREKAAAEKAGWTVITKDNAYWWAGPPGGTGK
jgi:zinc protease